MAHVLARDFVRRFEVAVERVRPRAQLRGLNWYEATQLGTRTNAFDSYLKAANEVSREEMRRDDPIARYLNLLEKEY